MDKLKQKKNLFISYSIPVLLIGTFALLSVISFKSLSNLQGNARVVNYTGIVRGATQQLVKEELSHYPDDPLIDRLDSIISNLQTGQGENDLILMDDPTYQKLLSSLKEEWQPLKDEIMNVRNGADTQRLYDLSQHYFALADKAVYAAEVCSEEAVRTTRHWLIGLNIIFLSLGILSFLYNKFQRDLSLKLQISEAASKEKSEFLSRMSHEIRTPMNGITGMTAIARMSLDDRAALTDCLEKIDMSSQHLLSLINDVLDMSRIENGKIELENKVFDLCKTLDGIYAMFVQRAKNSALAFVVSKEDLQVQWLSGDELRIRQILINLIGNSFKFTPEGGKVTLEVSQTALYDDSVKLHFSVTDTGIGMSEEFMEHMFEPFEQERNTDSRQYAGTGLGLSISYNLLKMMGADIQVSSRPGAGTRFDIDICLGLAMSTSVPKFTDNAEKDCSVHYDFSGKHILIAEDNEINAEIVLAFLKNTGAVLTHVWDGKEALNAFTSSLPDTYSLILMDMQMPIMNGLEATLAIRSQKRPDAHSVPIIALTANAFNSDREKAFRHGMNGYLSKPFELNEFLHTLNTFLNQK